MDSQIARYKALIDAGDIVAFQEIPNNTFTFGELEFLFMKGFIYEDNNRFRAAIVDL